MYRVCAPASVYALGKVVSIAAGVAAFPRARAAAQLFEHFNLAFTLIFTAELIFNIVTNWYARKAVCDCEASSLAGAVAAS